MQMDWVRATIVAGAGALTLSGCPSDNGNGDGESTAVAPTGSTGAPPAGSSGSDGSTGTAPADSSGTTTSATTSTDDGPTGSSTGVAATPCDAFCETVSSCRGTNLEACVADCEAISRYRADHYAPACVAAAESSLVCVAQLSCEKYDAFACDATEIEEVMTCQANLDPGPGIVAFCASQLDCGIAPVDCQLAFLEDFMRAAYIESCEVEYSALLSCAATVGCMASKAELEAACANESAALDGCNIFG